MNKKTKGEQLFIIGIICALAFLGLCLMGCAASCFGCAVACDCPAAGCISGFGCVSDGCLSDDSCVVTLNCIDMKEPYDDGDGKAAIIACGGTESGCDGDSGCYNGIFCGGCGACGNCGLFFRSEGEFSVDETTIGCLDGCVTCGDSEGEWGVLIAMIFATLLS